MAMVKQTKAREPAETEMASLPEGCIASVISFTSPADACRLALVSTIFMSAAESDTVWELFLPPGYESVISPLHFSSKKELFLSLCANPILIDNGRKIFSLDKWSGKKCYMISARDLKIVWGDDGRYWRCTSRPESSFPNLDELIDVCFLEIRGNISTGILSLRTLYTAYLVFKSTKRPYWIRGRGVEVSVGLVGSESHRRSVYLHTARKWTMQYPIHSLEQQASSLSENDDQYPKQRRDGWLEVKLGDFYNAGDDDDELEMSVFEVWAGYWKRGFVVRGIEIRPKWGE